MGSKTKVLVAGIGQSNFLKQLYSAIHKIAPNTYEFDIYGLNELSGKDEYGVDVFSRVYRKRKELYLKDLPNLFSLKLIYLSIQFLRFGASITTILGFIKRFAITKSQHQEYNFSDYDIVHIHFPTFEKLDLYWHIPEEVRCVVSFWGSDLMRSKGIFNYFIQGHVLRRANFITTHGNELKQQILTKFGRDLDFKVHITRFPAHDYFYFLMEEKLNEPKSNFRFFLDKYQIATGKRIVVIGHNGTPQNNHLKIIQALKGLPIEVKKGTFFVLPFSYKSSEDGGYEAKCEEALETAGLQGRLLTSFLPWDELAIFKCLTDIMIHMPLSDALSGAMTEALFAGTKVITGEWLPYGPFIKEGLVYETADFENLNEIFLKVYNTTAPRNEIELVRSKNREVIKSKFLSDYCAKTWLPILT